MRHAWLHVRGAGPPHTEPHSTGSTHNPICYIVLVSFVVYFMLNSSRLLRAPFVGVAVAVYVLELDARENPVILFKCA